MNRTVKGTILTLFGASCWGLCAVSGKFAVSERGVDPVWMVCLRLIVSGLIFLSFAVISQKRNASGSGVEPDEAASGSGTEPDETTSGSGVEPDETADLFAIWKDRDSVIRLILVAVFAFAVCQASYFASIGYSNPGTASAIQQTAPIFVMLYTVFILKRRPRVRELISLVVVMAGVYLLATHGDAGGLIIPGRALFWGLVSAVTCAGYTIMPQPLVRRYGTYQAAGWGMLLGGIFLAPVCGLWVLSGTWDILTVLAFAYVVIMGTIVAFGCFLYGVSIVGSVRGSIYALIEPVMAFLMSILVLGQHYAAPDYLGCAAILGGVVLLVLGGRESGEEE